MPQPTKSVPAPYGDHYGQVRRPLQEDGRRQHLLQLPQTLHFARQPLFSSRRKTRTDRQTDMQREQRFRQREQSFRQGVVDINGLVKGPAVSFERRGSSTYAACPQHKFNHSRCRPPRANAETTPTASALPVLLCVYHVLFNAR